MNTIQDTPKSLFYIVLFLSLFAPLPQFVKGNVRGQTKSNDNMQTQARRRAKKEMNINFSDQDDLQDRQGGDTSGTEYINKDDWLIRREGMADINGGNGLVREYYPCISAEEVTTKNLAANFQNGDGGEICPCSNGCCRLYNWLMCDENNNFPFLQCVCNGNTAKTVQKPTERPTQRPTSPQTHSPSAPPTLPTSTTATMPTSTTPIEFDEAEGSETSDTDKIVVSTVTTPVHGTLFYGNFAPDSCENGSAYQPLIESSLILKDLGVTQACFSDDDCENESECCLGELCVCGHQPNIPGTSCIPPYS